MVTKNTTRRGIRTADLGQELLRWVDHAEHRRSPASIEQDEESSQGGIERQRMRPSLGPKRFDVVQGLGVEHLDGAWHRKGHVDQPASRVEPQVIGSVGVARVAPRARAAGSMWIESE